MNHVVKTFTDVLRSKILCLGIMGCLIASVHYGLGRHIKTLSLEQSRTALKLLWIAFCLTPSAEAAAKFSISIMLIVSFSSAYHTFAVALFENRSSKRHHFRLRSRKAANNRQAYNHESEMENIPIQPDRPLWIDNFRNLCGSRWIMSAPRASLGPNIERLLRHWRTNNSSIYSGRYVC